MVRTSTVVALVAGMALALGLAGSAGAASSVNIVWKTSTTDVTGSTTAAPPTSLSALIILQGDTTIGVGGVFVSFYWDYIETVVMDTDPMCPGSCTIREFTPDGDELDASLNSGGSYALEHSGDASKVSMGNQFAPLTAGVTFFQDSDGSQHGITLGFDSGVGTGTGCLGCTVTLGSVHFTPTANTSDDDRYDVVLAVFPNGIDGVTSAKEGSLGGVAFPHNTVNFGGANLLPEPMSGAFGLAALGALGLLARRRR